MRLYNDYEELLQLLDEDSELGKSFAEIMNDIVKNEPINIQDALKINGMHNKSQTS